MRINLDTIGCRLNQSEIELMARQFRAAGHSLVPDPADADLMVLNSCAVTSAAVSDSRQKVRRAARAGAGKIVVTGCWASLEPGTAAALPGVVDVVPNDKKNKLVIDFLGLSAEEFDLEPVAREPLPGARLRTRAFIKVQEGCDNRCTFCVTTIARGPGRSRTVREIMADIQAAFRGGAKEVVLTGVHLGSWGNDFAQPQKLKTLVREVLRSSDIPRVRLSSLEPWDLDPEFFSLWENPRLCRHLHLPLQSGCAATLRRMARNTTPARFDRLLTTARQVVPEIAITTDIITGFPGETENEFSESLAFVKSQDFAGGHVFSYSARDGTAAARMPNQVPHQIRKTRNAGMRAAFNEAAVRYRSDFVGAELSVLWESATSMGPELWVLNGLSDNYVRISAEAPRACWNQITPVQVTGLTSNGLAGEYLPA